MSQSTPEENELKAAENQDNSRQTDLSVVDLEAALPQFGAPAPDKNRNGWSGVLVGGCLGGVFLNMALGFVVLGLARMGFAIYGPGVLAIVAAGLLLACVLREWPRRVLLGIFGVLLGMGFSFMALKMFVEPALRPISITSPSDAAPNQSAPNPAPNGNS